MKALLARLRVALVLAGAVAAVLVPTAWADSDHSHGGFLLRRASGVSTVTVSGPGISDTPNAVRCTSRASGWAAPLAGSNWISRQADCTAGMDQGDYTYTTTFSLPDLGTLTNLRLDGSVLVDDSVTVQLNGNTLSTGSGSTTPTTFSTTQNFLSGQNTLVFKVSNSGGGPTGVDFVVTVTANGATAGAVSNEEEEHGEHGACVSAVAHDHTTTGRNHGAAVSAAAHSCSH